MFVIVSKQKYKPTHGYQKASKTIRIFFLRVIYHIYFFTFYVII